MLGQGRISKRAAVVLVACALPAGAGAALAIAQSGQPVGSTPLAQPEFPDTSEVYTGPIPGEPPVDPDEFKALEGYSGPFFNESAVNGSVDVLEETVRQAPGSNWHVLGLARNQLASPLGGLRVTATLSSGDGQVLDTVSVTSPVSGLRPGEPAPFELRSDTAAADVTSVEYAAEPVDSAVPARSFNIVNYWRLPYGERERQVGGYPFADPETGPFPYVRFGRVENVGAQALPVKLVGAWLDEDDRVITIGEIRRVEISEDEQSAESDTAAIAPRSSDESVAEDFVYVNDDPDVAPRLTDAEFAVWMIGVTP